MKTMLIILVNSFTHSCICIYYKFYVYKYKYVYIYIYMYVYAHTHIQCRINYFIFPLIPLILLNNFMRFSTFFHLEIIV